jgi:hypothetical protein
MNFRVAIQSWKRKRRLAAATARHSRVGGNPEIQAAKNGSYEFTNEVQHYDKVLSLWENNIDISRWKTVVRLPDFGKAGNQSGKLQQLWIARRRQYRER